jgi:hypothetical protein
VGGSGESLLQNLFGTEICVLRSLRFVQEERFHMVGVTRRSVIRGGIAVVSVTALGFDTVVGAGSASATPRHSDFSGAVGQVFEATADGRTVRLRLTAADEITPPGSAKQAQSFVLIFEPLRDQRPDDAIYALRSKGVPTYDLFLSAVGPDSAMQAVVIGRA